MELDTHAAALPLVGRHREIARLERELALLERPRNGRGPEARFVLLTGAPGIGKTRLLEWLAEAADRRGHLVRAGRASEFDAGVPFAPLVDALDDYLRALPAARTSALGSECLAELAVAFPAFQDAHGQLPSQSPAERFRLHRAVGRLLAHLGALQPTVLLLDDLHWADEGTLELIAHLVRRRPKAPLLIAAGARAGRAPRRLADALSLVDREDAGRVIDLEPLTEADARELLGSELDEYGLYRLSGGNPFYLQALARAPATRAGAGDLAAAVAEVPPEVAAALQAELADLQAETLTTLRAAATLGEEFETDIVAAILQTPERRVLDAIEDGLARRLLRRGATPRRFSFAHPLDRHAVYAAMPPAAMLDLHARAAEVLAARGVAAERRAVHVARSAVAGDEAALEVLTEAGRVAAARSPASAARWFDAALALLPDAPGAEGAGRRLGLVVARAQALVAAGELEESAVSLREALSLVPGEAGVARARVVTAAAGVERLLGRRADARSLLESALGGLDDASSAEAAKLLVELCADAYFAGDFDRAVEYARRAVSAADSAGDALLMAATLAADSVASYHLADMRSCESSRVAAAALLDGLSDAEVAADLQAVLHVGWCELLCERTADALRHFQRGIRISRATGQAHLLTPMTHLSGTATSLRGDLVEAGRLLDEAIEMALLARTPQYLVWASAIRSAVAAGQGDLAAAVAIGERAVEAASSVADTHLGRRARIYLAEAHLEAGDAARFRSEVLHALGGSDLPMLERPLHGRWYALLARAELALGDVDAADGWARRAEETAAEAGLPARVADAALARSAVLAARGRLEAAVSEARLALDSYEQAEQPLGAAAARLAAGKALAGQGDAGSAIDLLRHARDAFDSGGARRRADDAARALRGLGERVPRIGARGNGNGGVASLSARELEVAGLVAGGLANKQIAAQLHLSVRTVENHVARIRAKLEAPSRAAVAAAVARAANVESAPET